MLLPDRARPGRPGAARFLLLSWAENSADRKALGGGESLPVRGLRPRVEAARQSRIAGDGLGDACSARPTRGQVKWASRAEHASVRKLCC